MSTRVVEMAGNGRLVIPHDVRHALGLRAGEQFTVDMRNGSVVLTPVALVPTDRQFPVTPALLDAVDRAASESGPGLTREQLRQQLGRSKA